MSAAGPREARTAIFGAQAAFRRCLATALAAALWAAAPAPASAARAADLREGDTTEGPAQSQAAAPGDTPSEAFKFTSGFYRSTGGGAQASTGLDLNLRYTGDVGDLWVGWYRQPTGSISQLRGGWDRSFALGPLRVMPSLQVASGGFVGGSLNVETGERWIAGAGLGRTNLRDYVNLNFDPNDAWMLSAGYRWDGGTSAMLQAVRDNRLHPDQQNVHLLVRLPLADRRRLAIDLLDKQGTLDDGRFIRRFGASLTFSGPVLFVRVAFDPKVNFSPQNMWRVSAGTRF